MFLCGWDVELRIIACTLLKMMAVPRSIACRLTLVNVKSDVYTPALVPGTSPAAADGSRRAAVADDAAAPAAVA